MSGEDILDKLKTMLTQAKEAILKQNEIIDELTGFPLVHAVVIEKNDKVVGRIGEVVLVGKKEYRVITIHTPSDPKNSLYDLANQEGEVTKEVPYKSLKLARHSCVVSVNGQLTETSDSKYVEVGDTVVYNEKTSSIVGKALIESGSGDVGIVSRDIDHKTCQVEVTGRTFAVLKSKFTVEAGDRVVVSSDGRVVVNNLGQPEVVKKADIPDVDWDDVIGVKEAKEEMIDAIESPIKYKDLFKQYDRRPTKGILMYGPPGCGKTLLAKAGETARRRLISQTSSGFTAIKGPELLSKYVGETESIIKALFDEKRNRFKKTGEFSVIFFDEADSLFQQRGKGISTDISNTIVPVLLTEMDGVEDSNCLVILATNRPEAIDEAVLREGRIDRRILVSRPDQSDVAKIVSLRLKKVPLHNGDSPKALGTYAADLAFDNPLLRKDISGSLSVGIADRTIRLAMKRDMSSGAKKATGIKKTDIEDAINLISRERVMS